MIINLLHEGALEVLRQIIRTLPGNDIATRLEVSSIAISTLYVMSMQARTCWLMVQQGVFQVIDVLLDIALSCLRYRSGVVNSNGSSPLNRADDIIFMCVGTLANLALEGRCRKHMLHMSATATLITLCKPGNSERVRSGCAIALRSLSSTPESAMTVTRMGGLSALCYMASSILAKDQMDSSTASDEQSNPDNGNDSIQRGCFLAMCAILACPVETLCAELRSLNAKEDTVDETVSAGEQIRSTINAVISLYESLPILASSAPDEYSEPDFSPLALLVALNNVAVSDQGRDILLNLAAKDKDVKNGNYRIFFLLLDFMRRPGNDASTTRATAWLENRSRVLAAETLFNLTGRSGKIISETTSGGASDVHQGCVRMMLESKRVLDGIVASLNDLSNEPEIVYICLSILYRITSSVSGCRRVVNHSETMSALIVRASKAENQPVKSNAICSALLCRLSEDKRSVGILVSKGLFSALIALSQTSDRNTRERSIVTISLMADADIEIRRAMVDQGALPVLMKMAGSHDPRIRQNSVAALCELTSCTEVKSKMVEQGAVKALVLTGLIRASEDDPETCNSCCKALYNLLSTEGKLQDIIADGVVWALTTMLTLTSEMRGLGIIGLCNIASQDLGRQEMTNLQTVKALTSLALTKNPTTRPPQEIRSICAFTLYNMACGRRSLGTPTEDSGSSRSHEDTITMLVQNGAVDALSDLSRLPDPDTKLACASALGVIATFRCTQERFLLNGGLESLVSLSQIDNMSIGTKRSWVIKRQCAIGVYSIAMSPSLRKRAVRDGAMELIHAVLSEAVVEQDIREICCKAVEMLSRDSMNRIALVKQGAIEALAKASGLNYEKILGSNMIANTNPINVKHEKSEGSFCFGTVSLRAMRQLSSGRSAACLDMVDAAATAVAKALLGTIPSSISPGILDESVLEDAATLCSNLSFGGEVRGMVGEGAIQILDITAKSKVPGTQLKSAVTLHNLSTDIKNHMPMVRQDAATILVELAYRSQRDDCLRCVAMTLCSMSMGEQCRSGLVRKGITRILCQLFLSTKERATDDLNTKYIALMLSNLARISKAQATIVKETDIVPLMALASQVSHSERTMVQIRRDVPDPEPAKPAASSTADSDLAVDDVYEDPGDVNTPSIPEMNAAPKNISWSTHDFDPSRTVPPKPTLPVVGAQDIVKIVEEGNQVASKEVDTSGRSAAAKASGPEENSNRAYGPASRYSKRPQLNGPSVLLNPTIEHIAQIFSKKAFLTMKELKMPGEVEDIVTSEAQSNDDTSIHDIEAGSNEHGAADNREMAVNSNEADLESKEHPPVFTPRPLSTAEDAPRFEVGVEVLPPKNFEGMFADSNSDRPCSRSATSFIMDSAKKAMIRSSREKTQRKEEADTFLGEMRNRATKLRMQEDSELRKILLENTYKWAVSERRQATLRSAGRWNASLIPDIEVENQQLSIRSLPDMMAEGIEKVMNARENLYSSEERKYDFNDSLSGGREVKKRFMRRRVNASKRLPRLHHRSEDQLDSGSALGYSDDEPDDSTIAGSAGDNVNEEQWVKYQRHRRRIAKRRRMKVRRKKVASMSVSLSDLGGVWPTA